MISEFIKKWGAKKLLLTISDIVSVFLASILAFALTSSKGFFNYVTDTAIIEKVIIFAIGCFLIIPIFRYYQLYKHKYFLRVGEQTLLILKGLLINSIIIIILIFIIKKIPAWKLFWG